MDEIFVSKNEYKMDRESFLKYSRDVVGYVSKKHFKLRFFKFMIDKFSQFNKTFYFMILIL